MNQPPKSTQPGLPSMYRCNEYQKKLESKQADHALARVRDLAVLAGVWLRAS